MTVFRHIALFRFTPETSEEILHDFKARLEALETLVPEVIEISVGRNMLTGEGRYQLSLIVDVADEGAYQRYLDHPAHLEVVGLYKESKEHITAVDYVL